MKIRTIIVTAFAFLAICSTDQTVARQPLSDSVIRQQIIDQSISA